MTNLSELQKSYQASLANTQNKDDNLYCDEFAHFIVKNTDKNALYQLLIEFRTHEPKYVDVIEHIAETNELPLFDDIVKRKNLLYRIYSSFLMFFAS